MAPRDTGRKRVKAEHDSNTRLSKRQLLDETAINIPSSVRSTSCIPNNIQGKNQEVIDLCAEAAVVTCKKLKRPLGKFPRFDDGDVVIELNRTILDFSYLLHRGVLASNSPWFKGALAQPWDDLDNDVAGGIKNRTGVSYRFELFREPGSDIEVLRRVVGPYFLVVSGDLSLSIHKESCTGGV